MGLTLAYTLAIHYNEAAPCQKESEVKNIFFQAHPRERMLTSVERHPLKPDPNP